MRLWIKGEAMSLHSTTVVETCEGIVEEKEVEKGRMIYGLEVYLMWALPFLPLPSPSFCFFRIKSLCSDLLSLFCNSAACSSVFSMSRQWQSNKTHPSTVLSEIFSIFSTNFIIISIIRPRFKIKIKITMSFGRNYHQMKELKLIHFYIQAI